MSTTPHETILKYTTDVHALVTHGVHAIERQVENLKHVSHQDAKVAVSAFAEMLRGQQTALAARIKALGGSASAPVKDAVTAVAGVAAGLVNAVRPSESAKSIRDDEVYFSGLGVSYLMLHTTSSSLGDEETATLAAKGYADTARAIMHITRILPKLVVEELAEDKTLQPAHVEEKASAMVRKAWDWAAPTGI